ncbi:MAG: extracellular solute-binding protein [Clostridiales bacterium]|nr:extracellular solute-binding protein [Clostridiales bacterium]
MVMKRMISMVCAAAMMVSLVACGGQSTASSTTTAASTTAAADSTAAAAETEKETASASNKLVVYTSMPEAVANAIIDGYHEATGVEVEVVVASGGELLTRIDSEKENPLGDVMMSGTISNVKNVSDLFADYQTENEDAVMDSMKNTEGNLTRLDVIGSVLIVNNELIGDMEITGYQDLLNPELKGKIAMADPNKSSSAWEHVVNMLYAMGEGDPEKGWEYVESFCAQLDGKLLGGSSAVYKGVMDGEYTVGLTSEGSAANQISAGADVSIVHMAEGVIFSGDGVFMIKGCKNEENAKSFLDYCTSLEAQTMMNDSLNCRTVRTDVPESSTLLAMDKINTIEVDQDFIAEQKKEWMDKFTDIYMDLQ